MSDRMQKMRFRPAALLLAAFLARAASGQDCGALVHSLGLPNARARAAAERALRKAGDAALEAELRGLTNHDPEISRSCRDLLAEQAPRAVPLLRQAASTDPRVLSLLRHLTVDACAHVEILIARKRPRRVFLGEVYLPAGHEAVLRPRAEDGTSGPAVRVETLVGTGGCDGGLEPLGGVVMRIGPHGETHLAAEVPYPTSLDLRGLLPEGTVALATVQRCSLSQFVHHEPTLLLDHMERKLAEAVAWNQQSETASAYLAASGSKTLPLILEGWVRRGSLSETVALLVQAGKKPVDLAALVPAEDAYRFLLALPSDLTDGDWLALADSAPPAVREEVLKLARVRRISADYLMRIREHLADPVPVLALRHRVGSDPAALYSFTMALVQDHLLDRERNFRAALADLDDPAWSGAAALALSRIGPDRAEAGALLARLAAGVFRPCGRRAAARLLSEIAPPPWAALPAGPVRDLPSAAGYLLWDLRILANRSGDLRLCAGLPQKGR